MQMSKRKNWLRLLSVLLVFVIAIGLFNFSVGKLNDGISRLLLLLDGIYPGSSLEGESESNPDETVADNQNDPHKRDQDNPPAQREPRPPDNNSNPPQLPLLPDEQSKTQEPEEKLPDDKPSDNQSRHAIFGYMPVADQSYLIGISNRFSLREIRMIIDAHHAGGEAWEESKQMIRDRVSEEEILRVQYLIEEYVL